MDEEGARGGSGDGGSRGNGGVEEGAREGSGGGGKREGLERDHGVVRVRKMLEGVVGVEWVEGVKGVCMGFSLGEMQLVLDVPFKFSSEYVSIAVLDDDRFLPIVQMVGGGG